MKIAYLMDQHPYLSSTFIRREIIGLESLGVEVARFSLRYPEIELLDEADRREAEKTRYILGVGLLGLIFNVCCVLITRPFRFLTAILLDLKLARKSRHSFRHLAYFAEACVLLRWLSNSGISIVHAHFGKNATTVAMLCNALGGPDYSCTVHGSGEFNEPRQLALTEKISRAAFVAGISSFTRSQLYRWCEYEHWSKIHEIRCCVDEGFLNAARCPIPHQSRLVCVGELNEAKGQLLLLEASARLHAEGFDFRLVFVGDGSFRKPMESLTARLHLEDRVEITGWADEATVREEILRSQVMVLPSFTEGLPVVIMEALALGRPVISTYIAGIPELVIPGECGWLVPAGSVSALVDAMREALQTPVDRLEAMGAAGAARVCERHNITVEATKLKELFENAISRSQPCRKK